MSAGVRLSFLIEGIDMGGPPVLRRVFDEYMSYAVAG